MRSVKLSILPGKCVIAFLCLRSSLHWLDLGFDFERTLKCRAFGPSFVLWWQDVSRFPILGIEAEVGRKQDYSDLAKVTLWAPRMEKTLILNQNAWSFSSEISILSKLGLKLKVWESCDSKVRYWEGPRHLWRCNSSLWNRMFSDFFPFCIVYEGVYSKLKMCRTAA